MEETPKDAATVMAQAADVILEQGVDFTVSNTSPSFLEKVAHTALKRSLHRTYVIYPIKLGTLVRISKLLLEVNDDTAEKDKSVIAGAAAAIVANTDRLAWIAALAITNDSEEPPASLLRYLKRNLNAHELSTLFGLVLQQMRIADFFGCLASVRGMTLLRTEAPRTSGGPSEASLNISGSDGTTSSGEEVGAT